MNKEKEEDKKKVVLIKEGKINKEGMKINKEYMKIDKWAQMNDTCLGGGGGLLDAASS